MSRCNFAGSCLHMFISTNQRAHSENFIFIYLFIFDENDDVV